MHVGGYLDPEYDLGREQTPKPQALPTITAGPKLYPGCCLALSSPLLEYFKALLPPSPALVLSIGSGYGLLEALLLFPPYNTNIVGVEVQPSSNQYLPSSHHLAVSGSRFLEPSAKDSAVWLFVYPKRVALVGEYIKEYGTGHVEKIIWAGPKADWDDYRPTFEDDTAGIRWRLETRSADEIGGRPWEMLAVATKSRIP